LPPPPSPPPPCPPPPTIPPSITAVKDPHLNLAYGGRADFRGNDHTIYNLFSTYGLSINAMIEHADFKLRNATIHGSFFTECHITSRTNHTNEFLNISLWVNKIGISNIVWSNMTCGNAYWRMGAKTYRKCHNIDIHTDYSSLHVSTSNWTVHMYLNHVHKFIKGPKKRIDIHITPRKNDFCMPHGLIGQSYSCEKTQLLGEIDEYPDTGEYTTKAWAKGAIHGSPEDYEMASNYNSHFKFSRFEYCKQCD
jgi:hypothetical protein